MKKYWSVIFVVLVLLSILGGCANSGQSMKQNEEILTRNELELDDTLVTFETTQIITQKETHHLEHMVEQLPNEHGRITAQELVDDKLIIGEQTLNGVELYWMALDGENGELPLPDDTEYIYAVFSSNDGFWLLWGSAPAAYRNYLGEVIINPCPEGRISIAHYDREMNIDCTILLQNSYNGNNERFTQLIKKEERFYLLSPELLVCVDEQGVEHARVETNMEDGWRFAAMEELNGKLYVLSLERVPGAGDMIWEYDLESMERTNAFELSAGTQYGLGKGDDGKLIVNGSQYVGLLDPIEAKVDVLISWGELGFDIKGEQIQVVDDGYVFYMPGEETVEMLFWAPGEARVKTKLTLAIMTNDVLSENIAAMVRTFNLSQEEYQIEYTIYNEMPNSGEQNIDLLCTQIMAGDSPDLLCFCGTGNGGGLPISFENVCVDILSVTADWSEIDKEELIPSLMTAVELNGKIHQFPLSFTIETFVAPEVLIADPGVTLVELEQIRAEAGDDWLTFESWNTPENLFLLSAPFYLGQYTNKDRGTCNFETQEFYDYLKWCKNWGGSGSMSDVSERSIMRYKQITNIEFLANLSDRAGNWFGVLGYTYAGVPNETCNGSMFSITSSLGISNQCKDISGALTFLNFCFDYIGENSLTIPANKEMLQKRIDEYIAGNKTDWIGNPSVISNDDAEKFYDLISETTVMKGTDDIVMQILCDEAALFFGEQSSAEQVAENIQNRVSLYLAEQTE